MGHFRYTRYAGGWWPAGSKEDAPPGTLRRARGVASKRHGPVVSRWGATEVAMVDAHSIVRFADQRFYGVAGQLLRGGAAVKTGLNGEPLDFLKMPTAPGKPDSLFVTGGGALFKVDQAGGVSNWGIAAPPNGFAASFIPSPAVDFNQANVGAGNLIGVYKYRVTFRDSVTGKESGVNPADVTTANLASRQISLTNIPVSGDPSVDSRRIYRTHGNGSIFFLAGTIADNVTTTIGDNSADAALTVEKGTQLQGVYQYRVTFRNSTTESRSNGNPTAVSVMGETDTAHAILLTGLPVSSDPQVDRREVWRTVGNGAIFFLVAEIADNTTTTYLDTTADVALDEQELPDDNNAPFVEFPFFQAVAGPHATRAWWRSTELGKRGLLYFSPVGRPEGVEDFIIVTNDDDPVQEALGWGAAFFAFSESGIFEVLGTGPFVARAVPECPGTLAGRTVVPTPFGIVYQATDGVRLFNGQSSRLLYADALGPLFHGESLEGVAAFEGVVAEYFENEYLISDEVETLALNVGDGAWRVLGWGARVMYAEDDTGLCLASVGGRVLAVEAENVLTDGGSPIPFEVEWPSVFIDPVYTATVQYIVLDIDTAGQVLTPTLILDGVEIALPPFASNGRGRVEWAIGRQAHIGGVRIAGALTAIVTIYAVDGEAHLPRPDESYTASATAARGSA